MSAESRAQQRVALAPFRLVSGATATRLSSPHRVAWAVVALGAALRIWRYADNRSLWVDESFLALNVTERSYRGLLEPLDFNQAAPAGFLLLERLSVDVFGGSELALRLLPLLAGLVSLVVFKHLVEQLTAPWPGVAALGVLALLEPLVLYASEAKQYGVDVGAVTVALALGVALNRSVRAQRVAAAAAGGAFLIWLSHAATLALAGVGLALFAAAVRARDRARMIGLAAVGLVWAVSFAGFYDISVPDAGELRKGYQTGLPRAFAPLPPASVDDMSWFWRNPLELSRLLQLPPVWDLLAALAVAVGAVALARRSGRRFWLLAAPVLVTLVASALERYPLLPRFELFLLPILLLFVAEGIAAVSRWTRPAPAAVLAALLLVFPAWLAAANALDRPGREETKPLIRHVAENWTEGDSLYLYAAAQYAFRYYADCGACGTRALVARTGPLRRTSSRGALRPALLSRPPALLVGSPPEAGRDVQLAELARLAGRPRVWVLFSHMYDPGTGLDSREYLLPKLDALGRRLDAWETEGAALYLYDLRAASPAT